MQHPIEPGWYWIKLTGGGTEIVNVWEVSESRIGTYRTGYDGPVFVNYEDGKWFIMHGFADFKMEVKWIELVQDHKAVTEPS